MRRGRRPTEDELHQWQAIARSAAPLRTAPPEPSAPPAAPPVQAPRPPEAAAPRAPLPAFRIGQTALPPPATAQTPGPSPADSLRAAAPRMDARKHRSLTRGKLAPEARLDLHGMTLAQAQPSLAAFVLEAQARGLRLVLVITGKGKAGGPDAPLPVRPAALRFAVPQWLHMAPLGPRVLQVVPAHRRHGGDGAYYVYLRR